MKRTLEIKAFDGVKFTLWSDFNKHTVHPVDFGWWNVCDSVNVTYEGHSIESLHWKNFTEDSSLASLFWGVFTSLLRILHWRVSLCTRSTGPWYFGEWRTIFVNETHYPKPFTFVRSATQCVHIVHTVPVLGSGGQANSKAIVSRRMASGPTAIGKQTIGKRRIGKRTIGKRKTSYRMASGQMTSEQLANRRDSMQANGKWSKSRRIGE